MVGCPPISKSFGLACRRCDNSCVTPLMKNDVLHNESRVKANLLTDQFVSVFTREESSNLPDLGDGLHLDVPTFEVSKTGVKKLLSNIKLHTASGPGNIPVYLLKEGAVELTPVFTPFFNATLHQGKISHD